MLALEMGKDVAMYTVCVKEVAKSLVQPSEGKSMETVLSAYNFVLIMWFAV